MRDFDEDWKERRSEEGRTFKVCGETFVMKKAVRPESLSPLIEDLGKVKDDASIEDSMQVLDALFLHMIEGGEEAEARYRVIRADEENGLSADDIREITEWMVEEQTRRPTESPSASTPGLRQTGKPSTVASSSRALSAA